MLSWSIKMAVGPIFPIWKVSLLGVPALTAANQILQIIMCVISHLIR